MGCMASHSLSGRRCRLYSSFLSTASADLPMLFLLLVYSLTQGNPGDASHIPSIQPREDFFCNDLNNGRTLWDIMWSCFSTIFLCTWVTLHPNITVPHSSHGTSRFKQSVVCPLLGFMKNKLPLLLCGLLAPEYILAWAVRQYLKAGDIQRKVPGWTRAHGFFLIMGGFHLYRLPADALSNPYPPEFNLPTKFDILQPLTPHSREEEIAEHPLDFEDLSIRTLAYLAPCKAEIADRGNSDVLTKFITLIQTLWFVAQCIARGVKHLPLTELEVVTLAYATMNIFIFYFWWDKPKDVECPIRVYKTLQAEQVERSRKRERYSGVRGRIQRMNIYITGTQDSFIRLSEEIHTPVFWSGNPSMSTVLRATLGASIIAIAFGGIHFVVWYSEFPSYIELILWQLSCIIITAVPLNLTIFVGGKEMNLGRNRWAALIGEGIAVSAPLTTSLYLFARVATLVIAFTTLRALPLDAFKTVDWTTFIPHL